MYIKQKFCKIFFMVGELTTIFFVVFKDPGIIRM